MNKKKHYSKLVSIVIVVILLLGSIPAMSSKAATSKNQEALRQDMLDLVFDGSDRVVDIRKYNLTFEEYAVVRDDVFFNEPSIRVVRECYANFAFRADKDGKYMNTLSIYFSEPELQQRYEKIQEVLEQLHSDMEGMKDIEKVLYTYNYVVQHTTYDLNAKYDGVASGPLVDGKAVCAGYAKAMLLALELEGMECKYVRNGGHGWVAVKLDGEWYHVDPTWGDTRTRVKGKTDYRFLLRNDSEFLSGNLNHGTIYDLPISSSTKYTDWYVHNIAGDMFYDAGYWYYLENNVIVKNNIEGTAKESVLEGTNLKIVSLEDGVLTYQDNGVLCEKMLSESEKIDEGETEAEKTEEGKIETEENEEEKIEEEKTEIGKNEEEKIEEEKTETEEKEETESEKKEEIIEEEKTESEKTEENEDEEEVTKEYTELECIEISKSNYNAYFSTGMKVKNSYTLEMKFQLTDENGCGRFLNYAPYKGSMIHLSQESTRGIKAGSSWYVKNITGTDTSTAFIYRKEKSEIYLNGTKMMTCPEMEFETASELLFGSGKGRIYYFKIWDENGTLIKDFIPVKDKEGTVCMYERVAGEYVYYTGSGIVNGIEK